MSSEQMKILDMLSENKISVEEATQLLDTITKQENDQRASGHPYHDHHEIPGFLGWLRDIFKAFGPKEKFEELIHKDLSSEGITAIATQTSNGRISVKGSESNQVQIKARKVIKAPTAQEAEAFAAQVELKTETEDGTLRIYKTHPKPPPGYEISFSYDIEGPRSLTLTLNSSNGTIETGHVEGDVKAVSSNGKIQLTDVTGQIDAHTSNGSISAQLETLQRASSFKTSNGSINVDVKNGVAPISASTSNGSIKLHLPDNYTAQVDAKTVNGTVSTDFETETTEQKKNRLMGKIGVGGDTLLRLRTSNGSIRFHKLGAPAVAEV